MPKSASNRIVGVHGIGNFYPAGPEFARADLSRRWTGIVRRSLRQVAWPHPGAVNVSVAYWAHLVQDASAESVQQAAAAGLLPDAVPWPGSSKASAGWVERGDVARNEEVAASGAEVGPHNGALAALRERLGRDSGEDIAGLLRVAEMREALARWERLRGRELRVRERLAMVAFDEVAAYLGSSEQRAACAELVAQLIHQERPRVVIAHSLGSVVAYEALHQVRGVEVDLLLTLGSPLGSPNSVMQVLLPQPVEGKGRRPDCVRHWVNIADPGDVVPFVQDLAPVFGGVDADLHPAIGPRGSHDAGRYLSSPTTAAVLVQHLR